ncbi:MAG: PD-(D/E)XK nuclease family transposase [Lachnospiraceae bacterium]|nr:PD-(D/E)XK nuclease family transposase [Lachnospiraceae bacterium]
MQRKCLQEYFPMLKSREELLSTIDQRKSLARMFYSWDEKYQREFLDFCSGAKGCKMLYDSFVKELLNPERYPERLNELLSLLIGTEVTILKVLPNEGMRVAAENSLLVMDIVVKLSDGSIANVEVQKVGYLFPGQRCACYSSDLLLRQYKAVRAGSGRKKFSYRDIKDVYTIVFLEKSGKLFHQYPDEYLQYFEQESKSGLKLELLQKYIFVPIDIFLKKGENKTINNRLEAWLTFLGSDDPEDIIRLIELYPDFKAMYQQIYDICQNMEEIMGLFSEELRILDENTVKLMIDEMQDELDEQRAELEEIRAKIKVQKAELNEKKAELNEKKAELDEKKAELSEKDVALAEKDRMLQEAMRRIAELEENSAIQSKIP